MKKRWVKGLAVLATAVLAFPIVGQVEGAQEVQAFTASTSSGGVASIALQISKQDLPQVSNELAHYQISGDEEWVCPTNENYFVSWCEWVVNGEPVEFSEADYNAAMTHFDAATSIQGNDLGLQYAEGLYSYKGDYMDGRYFASSEYISRDLTIVDNSTTVVLPVKLGDYSTQYILYARKTNGEWDEVYKVRDFESDLVFNFGQYLSDNYLYYELWSRDSITDANVSVSRFFTTAANVDAFKKLTGYTLNDNVNNVDNAALTEFVNRMYSVVLGREADPEGLNDWVSRLASGQAKAVDIVQGFMCSDEYKGKGKSNGEIVNDCYNAMLGRDADEGGYNDWVTKLDNGMSVQAIFAGFVGSQEFANLCNQYGIQPGTYTCNEARDQNQGVTAYAARLYTQALGRSYDTEGLNDWCARINANPSRENIIQVAATGFFHSQEFLNKDLSDEEYVKVLYRTFLGREAEEAGLNSWVAQLKDGKTRDDILPGFAYSDEFGNIMAQYGL